MIKPIFKTHLKDKILLIISLLIICIYLFSSCRSYQTLDWCGTGYVANNDFIIKVSDINYNAISDSIRILGEIQDSVTLEPLIGVNILVVGTTMGASTYLDGKF